MKYLIVGLGNVGIEYAFTRHNIGFMVLDRLASKQAATFQPDRLAALATCQYRGCTLYLIKPATYMNHSGRAVSYWLGKLKLPVEQCLVVVDDVALPFGKLRMRPQGTAAGHNGLRSIEASLGTQAYPRLRVGIGNDFPRGRQADYVLDPFTEKELEALPIPMDQACETVYTFCTLGIVRAMERYNRAKQM
ncbi:MAG: aminoacyl-tRNA hydrolase [Amoebophilaceae bacterium]|nr:aminoacyl-tRNA hydrolase [Amoebophilaceae bacterium]